MPKSTKRFILSTSQLNSHGFRSLTAGAQLDDFKANPIMYWLHITPSETDQNTPLPIGYWEDIEVNGDEISAVPNFDDSDEFAMKIYKKVEHGTLRAASVEVDPITVDPDKKNWLKGQKLPTVTEWNMGEASIVDRGSNRGAIVKTRLKGRSIVLSDQASADDFFQSLQQTKNEMDKVKLNAKQAKALKLAVGTEMDANELVDKLADAYEAQAVALKENTDKVTELEGKVTLAEKAAKVDACKVKLSKAVETKAITQQDADNVLEMVDGDVAKVDKYLLGKTPNPSIKEVLAGANAGAANNEVAELMKLTYDQLFANGGLAKLKKADTESYKLKFKEKFGREPVNV